MAARSILLRCPPFPDSLEQLGAPQSWKLVCFSVKVPVELLGFLALLAYIPSAYIARCPLLVGHGRGQGHKDTGQDEATECSAPEQQEKISHLINLYACCYFNSKFNYKTHFVLILIVRTLYDILNRQKLIRWWSVMEFNIKPSSCISALIRHK